jgi:NAD(P)-dependent dehydrogenase (short-subunit alcohol dehydrogenase family)
MASSSPSDNHKVAVVTGSSTGIGYETSLILARNGFLTYATMRNLNKSENIKLAATKENLPIQIKQLDITDDVSVTNAIQAISSAAGRSVSLRPCAIRILSPNSARVSESSRAARLETDP